MHHAALCAQEESREVYNSSALEALSRAGEQLGRTERLMRLSFTVFCNPLLTAQGRASRLGASLNQQTSIFPWDSERVIMGELSDQTRNQKLTTSVSVTFENIQCQDEGLVTKAHRIQISYAACAQGATAGIETSFSSPVRPSSCTHLIQCFYGAFAKSRV